MQNHKREFNPQAFQVFGPKIVAMRGAYGDRALESRFVTEVMGNTPLRTDIPLNLTGSMREEALALRNKLLLYRFRHRSALRFSSDSQIDGVSPRINQILLPLLEIVDDPAVRNTLVGFARAAHDEMIAARGLTMEAQLLEVIRELLASEAATTLPVGDISARFAERFGAEYTRPITPRWIGALLRRRLHLAPYKSHGRFVLPLFDKARLTVLYSRYGISDEESSERDGANVGGGVGDEGMIAA